MDKVNSEFNIDFSWLASGVEYENRLGLAVFFLNKQGFCKNSEHVLLSSLNEEHEFENNLGCKIFNKEPDGFLHLSEFNSDDHFCKKIVINLDFVPFYCKEILFFLYNSLNVFDDLQNFEEIKIRHNNSNFVHVPEKNCKLVRLGSLVRTSIDLDKEFFFSKELSSLNLDLVEIAKSFKINIFCENKV